MIARCLLYFIGSLLSTHFNRAFRGNASDFALTTLHVYSMIWNEKMSGGVMRYVPSPIICVPTSRCFSFLLPKIDLRNNNLFFLLTSCSHLTADEPALSKESIESNHVNTPTKSSPCSHFVPIFVVYFYINTRYKFSRFPPKKGGGLTFCSHFRMLKRRMAVKEMRALADFLRLSLRCRCRGEKP